MFSRKSILLIFALLLTVTGCVPALVVSVSSETSTALPDATTPAPTEEQTGPTEEQTGPAEVPNFAGEFQTYRDDLAGFEMDFPAEWYLQDDTLQGAKDSVAYTVSLVTWDPHAPMPPSKDLNSLPEGATKIDITVFNQGPETLADAVDQMKTQDTGASVTFTKEESWVLQDGQEAVYLEAEGAFGVTGTMITLVNGKTVYVSSYGDWSLFKAIAMSLRTVPILESLRG